LEILLDIGSSNESFYYLDGNNLGVEVGDIVSVRLRGRLLNGLVISKKNFQQSIMMKQILLEEKA